MAVIGADSLTSRLRFFCRTKDFTNGSSKKMQLPVAGRGNLEAAGFTH